MVPWQSLASLGAPYLIIHSTVSMATKACKQMGRFQRWGPTTAGKESRQEEWRVGGWWWWVGSSEAGTRVLRH